MAKLSGGNGQYGIALADNATIQMWPILIWSDGGDLIVNIRNQRSLGGRRIEGRESELTHSLIAVRLYLGRGIARRTSA